MYNLIELSVIKTWNDVTKKAVQPYKWLWLIEAENNSLRLSVPYQVTIDKDKSKYKNGQLVSPVKATEESVNTEKVIYRKHQFNITTKDYSSVAEMLETFIGKIKEIDDKLLISKQISYNNVDTLSIKDGRLVFNYQMAEKNTRGCNIRCNIPLNSFDNLKEGDWKEEFVTMVVRNNVVDNTAELGF